MFKAIKFILMLAVLTGVLSMASAIPEPGSPAIQPAAGYASITVNGGNPLDITVTATRPGFGVFWVCIFPGANSNCKPKPQANSVGWATQPDKNVAVWRTNNGTGPSGKTLVVPGQPGYLNNPNSGRFVASGGCTSAQYVIHVINLTTGNTFWTYPDGCPPPPCSISGPETLCPGSTGTWSVTPVPGAGYKWSLIGKGTIIGSNSGPSVSVKAGDCNTAFRLCVKVSIPCSTNQTTTSSECCIDVTAVDNGKPILSGQGADDIIECPKEPVFTPPTAKDDCDNSPQVLQYGNDVRVDLDCGYKLTRTWIAKDSCGNTSEPVSQTITVTDTKAPVLTPPSDVTVSCGGSTDPTATGFATAQDDCDNAPKVTYKDEVTPGECGKSGVIVRTWSAIDGCGNISKPATQTITIPQPSTISGYATVCNTAGPGNPVVGVTITLTRPDATTTSVVTLPDGSFSFTGCDIVSGNYTVTAQSPFGNLVVVGNPTVPVVVTAGECYTNINFCYREERGCKKVLILAADYYLIQNMYNGLLADGVPASEIDIAPYGSLGISPAHPNPLSEALDAKYASDGLPYCSIFFDPELGNYNGMFKGLSPIDQVRLRIELINGTGLVYAEPYNPMPFNVNPLGQLPDVVPVLAYTISDNSLQYKIVDPLSPLATGITSPFIALSGSQNNNVQLLPNPYVTYTNINIVGRSLSTLDPTNPLYGTNLPVIYTLNYGSGGGRVAIIGTDAFPVTTANPDLPQIIKLYVNAMKYTGNLP